MDVEEDPVPSGAASACKRQKRNTDSLDDGQLEDAAQVGEEKTDIKIQPVIDCTTVTTNNNNNDMLGKEYSLQGETEQPEKEIEKSEEDPTKNMSSEKEKQVEEQSVEEQPGTSKLECHLSPQAASAVLASNKPKFSNTVDSDDDPPMSPPPGDVPSAVTSPRFNQRNIPATRSYRRLNVELIGTMVDSESNDSDVVDVREDTEAAEVDSDDPVAATVDQPTDESGEDSSSNDEIVNYSLSSDSSSTESFQGEVEADEHFNSDDREKITCAVNEVLCKCKPKYKWNCDQELLHREHNIINRIGWRGGHTSAQSFGQGFYASRQVVEQMTRLSSLNQHEGCVNCLNFNRAGDMICSGSDDLHIVVWDWANEKPLHRFRSGHSMNIFQTKFIDSAGCLDIVSSSRDGQVRRSVIPPSGSINKPVRLYTHSDSVHKIVVVPHSRHEVMSAGEDAAVKHFDLRISSAATTLLRCVYQDEKERSRVRLFSIAHHPYAPEFCISGADDKLRVYDKRKLTKPLLEMTPSNIKDTKITQITCAVYNYSGSEILASYNDAGIYLFDSRNNKDGDYLHSYEGHINSRTIKGVNFFGPRSEYIISGSDCGNIFFWDKNTEAIINLMKGDHAGVVNCLEPHPWMPVLATSGLDNDVKIWTPNGPTKIVPDEDLLKHTLHRNFKRNIAESADFDHYNFQYFIRGFLGDSGLRSGRLPRINWPREQHSSSSSEDSSPSNPTPQRRSSNSSDDINGEGAAAAAALDTLHCRTQ
ncbi:DDB1- and CUL4-associated factor 8 [Drosophila eugracilis]|uniref:DDB1- and CUL4-associated factor 8 n=1 Tax=Drosophila eugracilis TaxID=29029 RepID=UPI0007E7C7E3|nr:DDB1- and CUL4-associated factor 8 [Drosophila eugracilis]